MAGTVRSVMGCQGSPFRPPFGLFLKPPPPPPPPPVPNTDFIDYIFRFPDQGAFLRDPVIQQFAPSVLGSQPGVQLLIFNPVETLQGPVPITGNVLVLPPQLAQSSVPLPGFWAMITLQGYMFPLVQHPNIQIVNDRTLMFQQLPSVLQTTVDVSHINIIINIFGVYVRDGLQLFSLTPAGSQSEPVPIIFG